ncbi:MAG: hypothetical protein R2780_11605 [Crocinitomicaceae bacterium]
MNKLKEKLLQKKNLWHVAAVATFLLVAMIYFYPALQGYSVKQGDYTNWVGAAQEIKDYRSLDQEIEWTNSMFSGMPSTQIGQLYEGTKPAKLVRNALVLWMPDPISYLFLYFIGFYILTLSLRFNPLIGIVSSLGYGLSSSLIIIIEAGHNTKAFASGIAPLVIAGMILTYRHKNWVLGIALSALFMTLELMANHVQITYYVGFILVGVGIVELIRYIKEGKKLLHFVKLSAGLLVAYFAAFLINSGVLLGTLEYGKYSTRGGTELTIKADGSENDDIKTSGLDKEYITAWSYGKGETFTFLVPNFKGGETMRIKDNEANESVIKGVKGQFKGIVKDQNQYWGDQPFTSGPVYLGVIVVFLALLGLIYSKDRLRWALLVVTILTVMLSWGKNFMGLTNVFIEYLPGYNKFRAVTIILVVAEICVPLLGAMFLHRLMKSRDEIKANIKPFFIASGILGALFLGFLLMPGLFNSFLSNGEQEALAGIQDPATYEYYTSVFKELENARISIFRKDVMRSFAFFLLAFGAVFAYIRGILSKYVVAGALGLLILFDMVMVDKRYLATEKTGKNYVQWTEQWKKDYPYNAGNGDLEIYNRELQKDGNILFSVDSAQKVLLSENPNMDAVEKSRALDWVRFRVLNRITNYRVLDLNNPFNSSYASYFHKSIGGYHGAKLGRYQELIEFQLGKNNPSVLDMLNMRYQIASQPGPGGTMNSQLVKENPTAMGNAWLTKNVKVVKDSDEEILALNAAEAVSVESVSPLYSVLVNGNVIEGPAKVSQRDKIEFTIMQPGPDGQIQIDTLDAGIPFQAVAELDLALIPKDGQLTWAYNDLLDSTFTKILIVSGGGREGWDPRNETVITEQFKSNVSQENYSGKGNIQMVSYNPENMVYSFSSDDKQLAVFSELYFPINWKAFVDGNETPISRVNYMLRAIEIPAGDHKVEFVYESESYSKSATYAYIGNAIVLLLFVGGFYFGMKNKGGEGSEEDQKEDSEKELK